MTTVRAADQAPAAPAPAASSSLAPERRARSSLEVPARRYLVKGDYNLSTSNKITFRYTHLDSISDILASNSSSYPTSAFSDSVQNPARLLNMHYLMPPQATPVELMSCGHTDPAVIELMNKLLPSYGLTPYKVEAESMGFIFNRIWAAIKRECLSVVADGVSTPQDIDQMWMINFGMSWGPFQLMDKVGLDVVRDIELHYMDERPGLPTNTIELLDEYIARGDLGKKSGKGFYDYSQES